MMPNNMEDKRLRLSIGAQGVLENGVWIPSNSAMVIGESQNSLYFDPSIALLFTVGPYVVSANRVINFTIIWHYLVSFRGVRYFSSTT
jgi:hypothetical protein